MSSTGPLETKSAWEDVGFLSAFDYCVHLVSAVADIFFIPRWPKNKSIISSTALKCRCKWTSLQVYNDGITVKEARQLSGCKMCCHKISQIVARKRALVASMVEEGGGQHSPYNINIDETALHNYSTQDNSGGSRNQRHGNISFPQRYNHISGENTTGALQMCDVFVSKQSAREMSTKYRERMKKEKDAAKAREKGSKTSCKRSDRWSWGG